MATVTKDDCVESGGRRTRHAALGHLATGRALVKMSVEAIRAKKRLSEIENGLRVYEWKLV